MTLDDEEAARYARGDRGKLSATMAIVLDEAIQHGGKLVRHAGGFWSWPNCPRVWYGKSGLEWWTGTSTVEALVKRKAMTYTKWRERENGGAFPIEATVSQDYISANEVSGIHDPR